MNSGFQFILLLACISLCTAAKPIKSCQCIKTNPTVRRDLVADVKEYEPSSYCNKRQVIVVLKDNTERCLDPQSQCTISILKAKKMQEKAQKTLSEKTSAETQSATATRASSATASSV